MEKSERPVDWIIAESPVPYEIAIERMERRIAAISSGEATECAWLLEHPPLYTAGVSASPADLKDPSRFPVFETKRGGQYTYHGPGQRVFYLMLDLKKRGRDVRAYVRSLENLIISTLDQFNIRGERRPGRVGVWVDRSQPGGPLREDKIAAIGVRIRKWITFHGASLNIEPDLSHFNGITPCGIETPGLGVTSLVDLGLPVTMEEGDAALRNSFEEIFGPTVLRSDTNP